VTFDINLNTLYFEFHVIPTDNIPQYSFIYGAHGGEVVWGFALQAGKSRIRFPMVSFEFSFDIVLPESTQLLTEMSTRNISWLVRRPVRRADNLTTTMCRLSWNSGSLKLLEHSGALQAFNGIVLPFTASSDWSWTRWDPVFCNSC